MPFGLSEIAQLSSLELHFHVALPLGGLWFSVNYPTGCLILSAELMFMLFIVSNRLLRHNLQLRTNNAHLRTSQTPHLGPCKSDITCRIPISRRRTQWGRSDWLLLVGLQVTDAEQTTRRKSISSSNREYTSRKGDAKLGGPVILSWIDTSLRCSAD